MKTVTVQMQDENLTLFQNYADSKGVSLSDLVNRLLLERLEDEQDLQAYHEAMEDYRNNPVSYSHSDVKKMFEDMP